MKQKKQEKNIKQTWMKYMYIFLLSFIGIILFIYAMGWVLSFTRYDAEWGVSFSSAHARSLGLDWQKTYEAVLDDLQPKHIRISALWNEMEPELGVYDFESVDWMLAQAAKRGTKVTLVVGQKAPRWPECHIPAWTKGNMVESKPAFLTFVSQVVRRYQVHPALDTWQVENEAFITFDFGECVGYDPNIIYDALSVVKKEDPHHLVMITDSGELNIWWKATRIGDTFGTTIYRMVRTPTGHRFTYGWLPPGLYKMRARLLGRPYEKFYVSELQAEPWFHEGNPTDTAIAVQEETLSPDILKKNIHYAERVGASRIYLWGVEWWYYMKTVNGDERYWEIVKEKF